MVRRRRPTPVIASGERPEPVRAVPAAHSAPIPLHLSAADMARALTQRTGLVIVDARATTLRMAGLFLATTEAVTMGQKLRLTIFLREEPLEVGGRVTSLHPRPVGGKPQGAEVTFDPLSEEAATLLEGFILAHWSGSPAS
jgi:Tfp pilus assembly protein PilZ